MANGDQSRNLDPTHHGTPQNCGVLEDEETRWWFRDVCARSLQVIPWASRELKGRHDRLLCQGLLIVSIFNNSDVLLSLVKNWLEGLTFITELFTEPFLGLVVGLPFHPCGIIFGQGVGDLQETVLYLQVCYRVQAASWNQWERTIAKVRFSTFNYKTGHIGHPTVKTGQI